MRQRNIGDRQRICIGNICLEGIVENISVIDTDSMKGTLESYNFDEYGSTQDFWYSDSAMPGMEVKRRRSRSMMPPEYVYKRAKDFEWSKYNEITEQQKKIANAFVVRFDDFRREGRGLYIYSETKGSGKTLLACCLANEIMERLDISVKFVSVTEYIELLKGKTDQEKEIVKALFDCRLLVLDDIGAEVTEKEWINNSVFRLVDYRDKNMLSTIYTSNYRMEDLPGDERTVNRILGHSIPVPMPEFSVRGMKAKEKTRAFLKSVLSDNQEDAFVAKE